jgi:hypothetical protein
MIHDMKAPPTESVEPFDDPAREREWQAQENAMRRERMHLDSRNDDARTQRYRMLARNLRQPLEEQLPADFAQQIASQLGPVRRRFDAPFESALIVVLGLALLIGSAIFLAPYSGQWWRSLISLSQSASSSLSLLIALAVCLGLTGLGGLGGSASSSAGKH